MILRKQKAVVYENKTNNEGNPSSLEKERDLNRDEDKMAIKSSLNQTSDENEKSFPTQNEITQKEVSLKLDSVKRISKFFEKDSLKRPDSPKINIKIDEKEGHVKRFDLYASPVFKEKVKTYQSLVQNKEEKKKRVFVKKNSEISLANNLPVEKCPSPDIISELSKPELTSSVKARDTEIKKDNETSDLKQEETTKVTEVQVNKEHESKDTVKIPISSKEEDKNITPGKEMKTSNEFKEKLKVYQALLQNSEEKKRKDFKKRNSEISITNKLPEENIEKTEVVPSLSQIKEASLVEIEEKTITENKEEQIPTKQEDTKISVVSTANDVQKIERDDITNNIATIAITSNQQVKETKTKNETTVSNDFKEKLKVYQNLLRSSEEKTTRELKKKNSKTKLSNNLTEEKVATSEIISSPVKIEQLALVEINEKTNSNSLEKSSIKEEEATIAPAVTDTPANEIEVKSNNISNNSNSSKLSEKEIKIDNDITTSIKEINDENEDKPVYVSALQKDKPVFESRSSSVKSIISRYQTSIQSNTETKSKETNKPVLSKHTSKPKIIVTKAQEDIVKQVEIDSVEERKNSSKKTEEIYDKSSDSQNINTLPSESASVRFKKEVTFLKERKDSVENITESEKPKTVIKFVENESRDENQIQKHESEINSPVSEEENYEDQPRPSIKDIIRNAKLEAALNEQNIKDNLSRKSITKAKVITNNKSPKENKVDLNEELKKTFKSRTFNNEVVSNDISEEETDNLNKGLKNDSKSDKVFKYKIGEKSEEEVISDWTPVNEIIIKTKEEVTKEKENNSKPMYRFNDSEIDEITYKNTQINAKTTNELKSILKVSKSPANPLQGTTPTNIRKAQKERIIENGHSANKSEKSDDNNNNNKKNTINLEKFIAKHLEKQIEETNTVEIPKQPSSKSAKHGATRIKQTNRPVASEYFKNTDSSKVIPNGTVVNSKAEQDFPEPDYD